MIKSTATTSSVNGCSIRCYPLFISVTIGGGLKITRLNALPESVRFSTNREFS